MPVSPDGSTRQSGIDGVAVVTGATGFIGAHLAATLSRLGCRVVAIHPPGSDPWRLTELSCCVDARAFDLSQPCSSDLIRSFAGASVVFHLAARGVDHRDTDARSIIETNVLGTLSVLEAARAAGVDRVVYCGSCFEYGAGTRIPENAPLRPVGEFGASKAAGWLLARAFGDRNGLSVVGVRPFTVYGPLERQDRLVPYAIGRALRDEPIECSSGDQRRDFVYVEDAVEAMIAAARTPGLGGEVLNVCSGDDISVRALVALILELTGSRSKPTFGALPLRSTDVATLSGDPTRAREILGWTAATSLREGVSRAVRFSSVGRSDGRRPHPAP